MAFANPKRLDTTRALFDRSNIQISLRQKACDTARGRISSGEGVMGMTWALFVAGCPRTVLSQWSVESESTTRLMIEFHRALLARNKQSDRMRNAAAALRDAQRKMLKTEAYSHPFHWAGFVVVGNGW